MTHIENLLTCLGILNNIQLFRYEHRVESRISAVGITLAKYVAECRGRWQEGCEWQWKEEAAVAAKPLSR